MLSKSQGKPARRTKSFQYGMFSPKALDFLDNSNAFMNILHGSVRSSKTTNANVRWLDFQANSPHDKFLLTGKTRDTIERNVIEDLISMIHGKLYYDYNKYDGYLDIGDKRNYIVGFNDEGATSRIQGMTVAGWYGDEAATAPESAIKMAMSRCSLSGAQIFLTMNPDSPYHYIYKQYINNPDLRKKGIVKVWHFTLEDNLNLDPSYIDNLKSLYSASKLQYDRYILGRWVIAEGAIYDKFVESENTFRMRPKLHDINICCDYGVSTVTTFGVMGIQRDPEGNSYYLLEETYYDAEVVGVAQSDDERVDDIVTLQDRYKLDSNNTLYLPHDAASLKTACEKDSRVKMRIITYTPDVNEDIGIIQRLIATRRFKIHVNCKNSIEQAQTYSWDKKAQAKGKDLPLKQDDHCCDMWRGGICGPMKTAKKQIYHAPRRVKI
ncbi:MAG: PBSX family phage terminase large subunit [Methanobrevibacter sp.]|nr:PBSX family phage terminase large subunit [Methanobrevibacter sp.]